MGEMRERMLRGEPYIADDPDITAEFARAQALLARFNAGEDVLGELLGEVGAGAVIRPPFHCEYGTRVRVGAGTFMNFDCLMLDVVEITIGARCQVGPRVQFITATHPLEPGPRREGWESAAPVTVGDNVWLGAGAILCPGVTVGEGTVVGAGAVVTRDLPAGVLAVGVPARVVRPLSG